MTEKNEFCSGVDILKSCNFKILLKNPARTLEWFIQEANLPGFQLGEMNVAWMAQNQRRPGDMHNWNNLSLNVLCDENLSAFKEAHACSFAIKNPETGEMGIPFEELFDAKMIIFTNKNNYQHEVTFVDAWIQMVGDLQLSHTTSEDDPVTFAVEIVYDYYKFEEIE